jgi:hypothetical protein
MNGIEASAVIASLPQDIPIASQGPKKVLEALAARRSLGADGD